MCALPALYLTAGLNSEQRGGVSEIRPIEINGSSTATAAAAAAIVAVVQQYSDMHLLAFRKLAGWWSCFLLLPLWASCRLAAGLPGTFEPVANASSFSRIHNATSDVEDSWLGYSCASIGGESHALHPSSLSQPCSKRATVYQIQCM